MKNDEGAGARAVGLRIRLDLGRVQDERLRAERAQLIVRGLDEHRSREQRVVGPAGDDAHGDPVGGIGPGEGVDDVELLPVEVGDDLLAQALEVLLGQRLVHAAPPDALLRPRLADDELVLRRAAGEAAGVDDERPALGEHALAPLQRVGVEQRRRRVPVHATDRGQPVVGEADRSAQLSLGGRGHDVVGPGKTGRKTDSRL